MTPEDISRAIWIAQHMARTLSARAQQLGDKPEARARISSRIGHLNQQITRLSRQLDTLTDRDGNI